MEQDGRLFSLAKELYQAHFWKDYWDGDLLAIKLPKRTEPVFISILGKAEENFGFLFYRNLEELTYFFETGKKAEIREFKSAVEMLQTQFCISLNYEDRDELPKEDYQRIKASGISFRGKKAWPIFTDYLPGYCPTEVRKEDIPLLIEMMEKLLETAETFRGKLDFYDEDREEFAILMRTYKRDGSYEDGSFVIPESVTQGIVELAKSYSPNFLTKFEMKRASTQKLGTSLWELDINIVGMPVEPPEGGRPFFPSILMVADMKSGEVICSEFVHPDDVEGIQRLVVQLILAENGRPPKVAIDADRHLKIAEYLGSVLDDLGIELVPVKKLPLISSVQSDMLEFFQSDTEGL